MIHTSFFKDDHKAADLAAFAEFVMHWTECLHGVGSLRDTLAQFARDIGARVVLVHRDCLETGRQRTIASSDAGAAAGERPLVRALGASLIATDPRAVVPGTLWSLGELDAARQDALDPRVLRWMDDRGLREAVVVPLGRDGGSLDILEFYLPAPLAARASGLSLLARLTAGSWARRDEARIARLLRTTPAVEARGGSPEPVANPLSPDNPWGLTAAEMRICALIRAGIDAGDIGARISVSQSTVRSHLRSIYAKGGVSGQVGLVRHLMADGAPPAPPAARVGKGLGARRAG